MRFCRNIICAVLVLTFFAVSNVISVNAQSVGSMVYFDNSSFGWDEVYVYVYGTKTNGNWPGEPMKKGEDGLYSASFTSDFLTEKVIFNNGKDGQEKKQYPATEGLSLNKGECRLLTGEVQWVYYGEPDNLSYGYAYMATNVSPDDDSIPVRLGLRGTVIGEYSIDGGPRVSYRDGTIITVGKGTVGNSYIVLQLYVTVDEIETTETYTFRKNYIPSSNTDSPIEVNFGTDKSSGQKAGTRLMLNAQAYNYDGAVTYEFVVNGEVIQKSTQNYAVWTPTKNGTYEIGVIATDSNGAVARATKTFVVGTLKQQKIKGDVNGDGSVDVADARIIQKYCIRSINLTDEELSVADYSGDGKVDIADATCIQKSVAGI